MLRKILGVIVGLIVGGIAVGAVEAIGHQVYPPPTGLDYKDPETTRRLIGELPAGALLFILAAHGCGAFVGGVVCAAIVRSRWWVGPIIVGGVYLLVGIALAFMIPAPLWFVVADLAVYLPAALLGGCLGMRLVGVRTAV